jgi:hypothetical protein
MNPSAGSRLVKEDDLRAAALRGEILVQPNRRAVRANPRPFATAEGWRCPVCGRGGLVRAHWEAHGWTRGPNGERVYTPEAQAILRARDAGR